jgi:pimeloyl-ACP methyl ester carboxylesterase
MTAPVPAILLTLLLLLGTTTTGCATSSMAPGDLQAVSSHGTDQRPGNAYLLRGWIGVFSTGIDSLTEQLNEAGVRAHVFQHRQWPELADELAATYNDDPDPEPLILIGHSYGADDVIRMARRLDEHGVTVDLLITLDPVTPPKVPGNVAQAINLYQSNGVFDVLPVLRGVGVEAAEGVALSDWNLRTDRRDLLEEAGHVDHFNIEKKAAIHGEIMNHVLAICPPRDVADGVATTE